MDLETRNLGHAETVLGIAKRTLALKFGEYRLSSGDTSSYYFDGRLVTLDAEGAFWVASAFLQVAKTCGAQAIAGPTLGADPIVAAVTLMSYQERCPIGGLIVRKEAKGHGEKRIIEGPIVPGLKVAVVDDTCSGGASLLHAIKEIEAAQCDVVKVMSILDRRQGGSDKILRLGYEFFSLLTADENGDIKPSGEISAAESTK